MKKKISSAAIHALKEALSCIYWYKSDLKAFLLNTLEDKYIISHINFDNYKRQIVSDLINYLVRNEEKYQNELLNLMNEVIQTNDFSHLERLEGGALKAKTAKGCVEALKKQMSGHLELITERQKVQERKEKSEKQILKTQSFKLRLESLKLDFYTLVSSTEPQKRGLKLEKLVIDLFVLFDLDPRASFTLKDEQIDGAFTFEGTDYLFEAKWHQSPIGGDDIDRFSAIVSRKLDNTLGLFLSISNFTENAIGLRVGSRSSIILMDGADLIAVLEERIDLQELLRRKRKYAAQTGKIFLSVSEILI